MGGKRMTAATSPLPVLTASLEDRITALDARIAALAAAVGRHAEHVDAARRAVMGGRMTPFDRIALDARLADAQFEFRQALEEVRPVAGDVRDAATLRDFTVMLAAPVPAAVPAPGRHRRARSPRGLAGDRPLMRPVPSPET